MPRGDRKGLLRLLWLLYLLCHCAIIQGRPTGPPLTRGQTGQDYKHSPLPLSSWFAPFSSCPGPIPLRQETPGAQVGTLTSTSAQASSPGSSWLSGQRTQGSRVHGVGYLRGRRLQGVALYWPRHLTLYRRADLGGGLLRCLAQGRLFWVSVCSQEHVNLFPEEF